MKIRAFLPLLLILIAVSSCKKKTATTTPTTTTACNGMNLCFKMDGTLETHNATWKVLSDRYRILWEEGTGSNYKNIEMDIYASSNGTYNIDSNGTAGKSSFQYYIQSGNKNIQGGTGTVTISNIGTANISGTFTITAWEGSTKHEITEGNFVNVPK